MRKTPHLPDSRSDAPPRSFRTEQADAFSFHVRSCERVGLRREKSLFLFVASIHSHYHDKNRPYHIDYVFLPQPWTSQIQRVEVGSHAAWSKLSDHVPLSVDVTVPAS